MDHSTEPGSGRLRSLETMVEQAAAFHVEHAADLEVHQPATTRAVRRRWTRPVMAAAAVAVLAASVVLVTQGGRTDGTAVAAADQVPFSVVDGGRSADRCQDLSVDSVVVPGTATPDFHLEAALYNNSLCLTTQGPRPRGSTIIGPEAGPVPYFAATGFPGDEVDNVLASDWLAMGAVGPDVEAIRFVPDTVGSVQWIREVTTLGDLKVFGFSFTAAGRLEFLRQGAVVATEVLPEPTLRQTISTLLPEPTGPPCGDVSTWEMSVPVPVQQAQTGDRAVAAHDSRSSMGRHFRCLQLTTDAGEVRLWTGPIQTGVWSAVGTYQFGGGRFLIVQMGGIVARLDVTVGGGPTVSYEADEIGLDEWGYATVIARIPAEGDYELQAYEETGRIINIPAPSSTFDVVEQS